MKELTESELKAIVLGRFQKAGIEVAKSTVKSFPGETIIIVEVRADDFSAAADLAGNLDGEIPNGFVTIRKIDSVGSHIESSSVNSINEEKVTHLIELLNERSRTSETQPALNYVGDVTATVRVAITKRNQLIFGRRGVGKTALMLEAKRIVESHGNSVVWINLQSFRGLNATNAFLTVARRICELPLLALGNRKNGASKKRAEEIVESIDKLSTRSTVPEKKVNMLIPSIQGLLKLFTTEMQNDVFLFLDDVHYLEMTEQALFLDMIHGVTRDAGVWLKVAGIRHQMRYFQNDPPLGLEPIHDASEINLDISTLEEPRKAKDFLIKILRTYLDRAKISNITGFISGPAIDRLVLASGGVPRDFLLLCATTIQIARRRSNARQAGVQDVNEAAGETAKTKLKELYDDAASSIGKAAPKVNALEILTENILNVAHCTFFLVAFNDKERHPAEYRLLQSLMDLRMIHLLRAGISDAHEAGKRYEVYLIDLNRYSSARLKQKLRALDFEKGYLVLKYTGTNTKPKVGNNPNATLSILRSGPIFELEDLTEHAV